MGVTSRWMSSETESATSRFLKLKEKIRYQTKNFLSNFLENQNLKYHLFKASKEFENELQITWINEIQFDFP